MLRLPPFTFRQARDLREAAEILAGEGPDCRLVAGGTDLWPNMKRRHQKARTVVSLMGIEGLAGVSNGDGVALGATTLLDDVANSPLVRGSYPALAKAVASISSPPLRNMGTIGGNVMVGHALHVLQPDGGMAALDRLLHEGGGHRLLGGAELARAAGRTTPRTPRRCCAPWEPRSTWSRPRGSGH